MTYRECSPGPVRLRPMSWMQVATESEVRWLMSDDITRRVDGRHKGDRWIYSDRLEHACTRLDLEDAAEQRAAFVAVMAWGSGTSNSRSYRNTKAALADPRLEDASAKLLCSCKRMTPRTSPPLIAAGRSTVFDDPSSRSGSGTRDASLPGAGNH